MRVLALLLLVAVACVSASGVVIYRWVPDELAITPAPGARLFESGCVNGTAVPARGTVSALANKNTRGDLGYFDASGHVSKFRIAVLPNSKMPTGAITRIAFRVILAGFPVSGRWDIFPLRGGRYVGAACSMTKADTCIWVFDDGLPVAPGSDVGLEVWATGKFADYASRWCVTRFALIIEITV